MNSDELELIRSILQNQDRLTDLLFDVLALLEEREDDGPTFRTMAERQADETDDFDRL